MKTLKDNFIASGGKWKEYELGKLFDVKSNPQLNKDSFVFNDDAKYPYFTRTVFNNGIAGYVEYLDDKHLIKGNSIAVGMLGMKFFYMPHDFYAGQFTKTLYPKFDNFNANIALYFISLLNKCNTSFMGLVRNFKKQFEDTKILLPTTIDDEIAYDFIEEYITILEKEQLEELKNQLKANKLDNTILTKDEQLALDLFRDGKIDFQRRTIGEMFRDIKVNTLNYKVGDLKNKHDAIYNLPALTSGTDNQGLSCYVPRTNATILKNVLSVALNGSAGTTFYQSDEFTVLQDSYAIKHIKEETSKHVYLFFASVLHNSLRLKYDWNYKAYWNKVKEEYVLVPVNDEGLNYDFMENFIAAQEKIVLKGVFDYIDSTI